MIVTADKGNAKNKTGCSDPNVIFRDWIAMSFQIQTNLGITRSNRFINRHYKRIPSELMDKLFVVLLFRTVECTIQEFADNRNG